MKRKPNGQDAILHLVIKQVDRYLKKKISVAHSDMATCLGLEFALYRVLTSRGMFTSVKFIFS
jgi:hypothetical protein